MKKFNSGDIVYHKRRMDGDERLYLIDYAGLDYAKVICLFRKGIIVNDNHSLPRTWWNGKGHQKNAELATAKTIESLAFPEGLAFLKANIDANIFKNSPAMNHLIVAVEKGKSATPIHIMCDYETGLGVWTEGPKKVCDCSMFILLSQGCSCGGR